MKGSEYMRKKKLIALYFIILVIVAAFIVSIMDKQGDIFGTERQTKYTMYIGLNDGDTQEQKFTAEQAKSMMYDICRKYTGGYTIYDARGYWYDDTKPATLSENTLVCVFFDIEPENVKSIMDDAIRAFNQNSILLETQEVRRAFYEK